jgi:hypothetical protein
MMEGEFLRRLVDDGGPAATRCLAWLVEGTTSGAKSRFDPVWPAAPIVL